MKNKASFSQAKNIKYKHNDLDELKLMLKQGFPTIMYGIPCLNVHKSHAWNVDGFKERKRITTVTTYVGESDVVIESSSSYEIESFLHLDLGQYGGAGNGYYISDAFNNKSSEVEFDDAEAREDFNYNVALHYIYYKL